MVAGKSNHQQAPSGGSKLDAALHRSGGAADGGRKYNIISSVRTVDCYPVSAPCRSNSTTLRSHLPPAPHRSACIDPPSYVITKLVARQDVQVVENRVSRLIPGHPASYMSMLSCSGFTVVWPKQNGLRCAPRVARVDLRSRWSMVWLRERAYIQAVHLDHNRLQHHADLHV